MEKKKTKLTISGDSKKKIKSFQSTKPKGQKTVFIDKQQDRSPKKAGFSKNFGLNLRHFFKKGSTFNNKFPSKSPPVQSDFERR